MSSTSQQPTSCALPYIPSMAEPPATIGNHADSELQSMEKSESGKDATTKPASVTPSFNNHASTSAFATQPTAAQRRRLKEMATALLLLTTCPACSRPLQDPVSLPCGHSACVQCIKDRVSPKHDIQPSASLPCLTHLPPRLPLSETTVPCLVSGCPRSAIGRGIGVWAGHMSRYGLATTVDYPDRKDGGCGSAPLDGFIIGVSEHPLNLTVIAPQLRTEAHLFAVQPSASSHHATASGTESAPSVAPSIATSNLLRTDVTLTKAVSVLQRYANAARPSPPLRNFVASPFSSHFHPHRRGRSRALARVRGAYRTRGTSSRSSDSTTHSHIPSLHSRAKPRTRSSLSHPGMGNFGMNESDLESGTVGGVSAVLSDSEDDEEDDSYRDEADFEAQDGTWASALVDDDESEGEVEAETEEEEDEHLWPDQVGGAFSRPLIRSNRRNRDNLKRRRSKPFEDCPVDSSTRRGDADFKVARIDELQDHEQWEAGWSTEDSAVDSTANGPTSSTVQPPNAALKSNVRGEALVQSIATLHLEMVETLECHLCYLLLYQPLTTPCGHTFCRSCFARSLDHGNKCPLCRTEMPNFSFFQEHAPNAVLLSILTSDTAVSDEEVESRFSTTATGSESELYPHHFGFKRLYEQRKATIEQEEREARLSTPIFVCTLAFPGMPTILHIFEPRYRLMVRRCIESGNPRFGMVMPSRSNGGMEEYGTMLEIKSMQMLADGRSMIETVGSYRFKLLEKGSLDGYTVGRVERIDDISPEAEAELERAVLLRRNALDRHKAESTATEPESSQLTQTDAAAVAEPQDSTQAGASQSSTTPTDIPLFSAPADTSTVTTSDAAADSNRQGDDDDGSLAPFPPVPAEPSTAELIEICTTFIQTLQSGSAPWLLSRLNHTYGAMPKADEVERLGYWMALVMPIDEHEKARLLPITSRRLRLALVVHWIEQLRQSWWFNSGCTVS